MTKNEPSMRQVCVRHNCRPLDHCYRIETRGEKEMDGIIQMLYTILSRSEQE